MWRARGPEGIVAVKLARSPRERTRLVAAGELLERLEHPNIVRGLGHDPAGRWLAMELVDGVPLHRWAAGRSLTERITLLSQLIAAVAFLHDEGVTHGDLKPDNVLVNAEDRPTLLDLSPGIGGGTLGYAAPEQLLGGWAGPPADVYALGCLGYRLLCDEAPFAATDRAALLWMPVNTLPIPPSSLTPGIPAGLEALVMACLARTPSARPTDLHRLASDLSASLASPTARPVFGMLEARRLLRRRLIEAMEGGSPMMAILGAPRSGRSTLIEEILTAAEREGLAIHRPTRAAVPTMLARLAQAPFALRLEATDPHTADLCAAIQRESCPGITLIRAESPPPDLPPSACVQPTRLEEGDIANMLEIAGQFPGLALDVHRITRGHPGVVRDYILRRGLPSDLTASQRALLTAVTTGPRSPYVLAGRLGLSEHALLDIAEPLIERGLLEERGGGATLVAVLPRPLPR
ncbi:MAG: hypothetical protein ACI8RZ_000252 [Myxococcota bacterium]